MRTLSINSHKNFHTLHIVCVYSVVSVSFRPPWTVAHQAPLSMEFSRQEHWKGLPFPPAGALPNPETEPTSLPPSDWWANSLPLHYLGSLYII